MTTRKNIITLAGGGSTLAPNIVRGGKAIDLGNNFYYIKGRKHKNGGVDVGENAKTGLEVEGEEVMQVKPNEVRVFSSVPFLRGVSPAELVMNGNNPDAVFNAQERFKDINKINDDGTKAKYGKSKKNNNMIASINGNVKNGLIHTEMKCGGRRKVKVGTGFRINNDKYNIGDTINYKGQTYVIDDRNTAKPIQKELPNTLSFAENLKKVADMKLVDRLNDTNFYADWIRRNADYSKPAINKYISTNNLKTIPTQTIKLNDIKSNTIPTAIKQTTTPAISTTSTTPAISKTSSVSSPVEELIDDGDYTPDYSNDKLEAIKYNAPKNQLISKLENDLLKPVSNNQNSWWDNNLDKINLYTNIGASAADFITSTILNSQLPTYNLPTMTAPTLANLPEIQLADIKEIEAPKSVAAAKLKTRYNANPQLSKIEDETRRTIDDIDRNTADSRVALARKQRARIASQEAKNQVYGQKENIETELINKDKLNAQAVAQSNANAYNNYLAAKAQQAMGKAQLQMMVDKANIGNKLAVDQFNANAKLTADQFNTNNKIKEILSNNAIETTKLNDYAQGVSNLLGNIGGSIDNYTTNKMSRKRDAEKLRAIETLAPNIPNELKQYILKGLI